MGAAPAYRPFLRVLISAALLLVSETATLAVKQAVQVIKPEFAHELGFSTNVKRNESGELEFKVIRDLSKARSVPPDSELMIRRSATLKVFNSTGLVVSCDLEPTKDGQTQIYRFTVAREYVPLSYLTIAEIDDYKDASREHLIGGGTFYRIRLADFTEPAQPR